MSCSKRYTITAALPYTNGPIHIGHLAGVYLPSDIYARYLRLTGNDVAYICGSDEHGVAIPIRAKKEGVSPKAIIDKYHAMIDQSFKDFGISFDNYSRTSSKMHHKTASEFFTTLDANGQFTEKITHQLYDAEANQFLADRFVVGTCPKCGFEASYGDQCEQCGTTHNGTDLIHPISAITGNTPTVRKTRHWFLPLDRHASFLRQWILQEHNKDWKPNVLGQVKSWIDEGLRPRAVTRDLEWGIPVPAKGGEGKVLYVWFDAPIGYLSSTKEWANRVGKNWEDYWKDNDTKLIHFIGKDNIVFHCIIFPAMLRAHGGYILPENVPANEFLNLEGNKLSTSKNWAVWLHEYLEDFPNQQDVLRYTLTAIIPENKDSDFTWKDFQAKNNNELVAIFGNFVNRVVVLTHKYFDGFVLLGSEFTKCDQTVLAAITNVTDKIGTHIQHYRFREALQELMNLARLGNKYLADQVPWKVIKQDEERVKTILHVAVQIVAALAVLCEPFLPFTSSKLRTMLRFSSNSNKNTWQELSEKGALLAVGHCIGEAELLFAKIEHKTIVHQLKKLAATKNANQLENKKRIPLKDIIEFETFTKLDLRIGTIVEASRVAKTKKLLQLKVDMGIEIRTIVSGIAESFLPEEIIGQQVTVLTNLASRKIKGVVSRGMILMTQTDDGQLAFVEPEQKVSNGQQIS